MKPAKSDILFPAAISRYCIITLLLVLSAVKVYPDADSRLLDSILVVLDREINNCEFYYQKKENRLETLKKQLHYIEDPRVKYGLCDQLFDEYINYQYDSAYSYASQARQIADKLHDELLDIRADYNLFYCYVSTGLFKEAYDIMSSINVQNAPDNIKVAYYELCMRLFSDMSSYNAGTPFEMEYNDRIVLYCDSALMYAQPGTYEYERITAFQLRDWEYHLQKLDLYNHILNTYEVDSHGKAIIYSTLGRIYYGMSQGDKGAYYMALSAIEDIKSATRETTAKTELAGHLFNKGEVIKASHYIRMALQEVTAYNARHRKMEINSVLPIIEKQRLEIIEQQKKELAKLLLTVSALVVALFIALFVIYKQIRKLKKAKHAIQQQYNEISAVNSKLEETNEIKDQYIFQSLYGKSDYLEMVEGLLKKQDRKIKARQYDDLLGLYKEFNIKTERENIFSSFDETFVKLFPNFVQEYNKFFKPEDRVVPDSINTLTPELRIFALIRLGVSENERIAKFLNLSVNTIYVYKAKVKGKTIIPKEEFEYRIMQIRKG